jgi:hypothetical protein
MSELSYIKNEPYTSKVKYDSHLWYGLQKVLGKEFCKTGYFKPFWPAISKGEPFVHIVNGVHINASMESGIRIERVENVSDEVVAEAKGKMPLFGQVQESGEGTICDVRFYHRKRQVGYLETTRLNDETEATGKEIAKQLKVPTHELTVTKTWERELEGGKPEDYL